MLDLSFVRANLELVEGKLRDRGQDPAELLGNFGALDKERRERITEAEQLKAQRNKLSEEVARLKKSGQDASAAMEQTRALKADTERLERSAVDKETEMRSILERIPNLPMADVPVGKTEQENVEVKRWGAIPQFDFAAQPHWEIGERLGILDFERAAKLSGARFAVYWGDGARLERALISFMLDVHTREHGYTEVLPPFMVNSKSLFGTGQLPKFAEDLFRCVDEHGLEPGVYRDNDHWLIPTAEVPVTNLYRDEVLEEAELTRSLTAYTPCFRSEAGSYGKDVRGIIRQHQFQKVELVKFARPEDSEREHERLTRDAETILERLELPYRRVLLCTGDMGFSSAKTFDLEVWLPGQNLYREISSCSNFGDFQARRANIRYRPKGGNKTALVHTLNGSGLAAGRTWLAILENYQQKDGSVRVPDALVPYMGGLSVIKPREHAGEK
ncbi:MAG TPA: serine--tRNA ligase [Silvibacterium sp.]|nr:serine--tRNA ligase [Silvibacterium sp.]